LGDDGDRLIIDGHGASDDRLIVDGRDASDDGIDIYEVMRLLGISESSVWRGVRSQPPRIPLPFYPQPRAARWVRREIIATREALRMSPRQAMIERARKKQAEPIAG
jgi:predicted DNA-binding transcriptional regulator AlpA